MVDLLPQLIGFGGKVLSSMRTLKNGSRMDLRVPRETDPASKNVIGGDPKTVFGISLVQKQLKIDDQYHLLSPEDRSILLKLRGLEREHCTFKPPSELTREKTLKILDQANQLIQKADTEFALLVINEKAFVAAYGEKYNFAPHDSALIKLSFYPDIINDKNAFWGMTHNHPNGLCQDLGDYISFPPSFSDLQGFAQGKQSIYQVLDYSGTLYTLEASAKTNKSPFLDYVTGLSQGKEALLFNSQFEGIAKMMESPTGTESPDFLDLRNQILEYAENAEANLPEMAEKFAFAYTKTSLNRNEPLWF
ncbi:MAG: hypothetical protein ACKO3R_09430 [bacterium]